MGISQNEPVVVTGRFNLNSPQGIIHESLYDGNPSFLGDATAQIGYEADQLEVLPCCRFTEIDATAPFERGVTLTLAHALQALLAASSEALSENSLNRERLAEEGVSANLCESVAAVPGGETFRRRVGVRFSYAAARPAGEGAVRLARFSSDLAPIIAEIGKDLCDELKLTPDDVGRYLEYPRWSIWSNPFRGLPVVLGDPKDDPVVYTAIAASADVLCTRDKKFFAPNVIAFAEKHDLSIMDERPPCSRGCAKGSE
jgi:hypothetical protein